MGSNLSATDEYTARADVAAGTLLARLAEQAVDYKPEKYFRVRCSRSSSSDDLGVTLTRQDLNSLKVDGVKEHGLVPTWNQEACEAERVQPGDLIMFVNGLSDSTETLAALQRDRGVLNLVVQRAPGRVQAAYCDARHEEALSWQRLLPSKVPAAAAAAKGKEFSDDSQLACFLRDRKNNLAAKHRRRPSKCPSPAAMKRSPSLSMVGPSQDPDCVANLTPGAVKRWRERRNAIVAESQDQLLEYRFSSFDGPTACVCSH
eukprot:TRINITY_DN111700_c0_g1_i1.p1 TRINITY_DN111700_c0_g1~~TRINITY_DN111700_c0_g1_i1.p1  ORF type:complete len:260 (+),score=59.15 TRINITY_DN111700_c0_g1_i1:74-853(+)